MKGRCVTDPGYDTVNNCFERSLVWMHKMPRVCYYFLHSHTHPYSCALDLDWLLQVLDQARQGDEDPASVWPRTPSSAAHSARQDLASLHQVRHHAQHPGDSHQSVQEKSPDVPGEQWTIHRLLSFCGKTWWGLSGIDRTKVLKTIHSTALSVL